MIIYFSATGNSKYTAKKLAAEGERVISIADCFRDDAFDFTFQDDESVGFVMPVYFYGIPTIVADFINRLKLSGYKKQYTYCVFTLGGSAGIAAKMLGKALSGKGLHLDSAFSVVMPDNYIILFDLLTPKEKIPAVLSEGEKQIAQIKAHIAKRERGIFRVKHSFFPWAETFFSYPVYKYGRSTAPFNVNENCISCGLCERMCPCSVITLKDGKPAWKEGKCTQCLGCIHRCPVQAINYGEKTRTRGRYQNPFM